MSNELMWSALIAASMAAAVWHIVIWFALGAKTDIKSLLGIHETTVESAWATVKEPSYGAFLRYLGGTVAGLVVYLAVTVNGMSSLPC